MNRKQIDLIKTYFLNGLVIDYLARCRKENIKLEIYRNRVVGCDLNSQKDYIDFVEYLYKEYGYKPKTTSDMVITVIKETEDTIDSIINSIVNTFKGGE